MDVRTGEPCGCGVPDCWCGKCHGTDWVYVTAGYPLAQVPDPPVDVLVVVSMEVQEAVTRQLCLARAAAANSVYPCRACAPSLFYRWRDGHLESDHDRERCQDCISVGAAVSKKRVHA